MDPGSSSPNSWLITKLGSPADISASERAVIESLPLVIRQIPPHIDVVSEGDTPNICGLVLDGFACRYKVLQGGQRQILSFHMRGDMPDLHGMFLKTVDHSVGSLTAMTVGFIAHDVLHRAMEAEPGLGRLLWRETLIDAAIFREWLVSQGRRTATQQIGHLICELFVKMRAVGLVEDHSMIIPFTQQELGDALGLSTVHVNRVLQELRHSGLITGHRSTIVVPDWERLKIYSEFSPTYLHVRPELAAS